MDWTHRCKEWQAESGLFPTRKSVMMFRPNRLETGTAPLPSVAGATSEGAYLKALAAQLPPVHSRMTCRNYSQPTLHLLSSR